MSKSKPAMNLAIKCNWNDAGYQGVCSDEAYVYNVNVKKAAWCSSEECICRAYVGEEIREDNYPCMESQIFVNHCCHITGNPYQVKKSEPGKYVLLTTRLPETPESERIIFGYLLIHDIYENEELLYPATTLVGDPEQSFCIPKEVAVKMKFWNYYRNAGNGKPQWGSGLFRYMPDERVTRFLHDLQTELDNQ